MSTRKPVKNTSKKTNRYSAAPVSEKKVAARAAVAAIPAVAAPVVSKAIPVAAAPVAPVAAKPSNEPSAVAAALIKALRDSSADAAREAAISLGKLGEHSAVAPLIEVVENSDGYYHCVVRAAACASLGQLRDKSATPALVGAVSDPMAEASAEAVRALATIGDQRAVEPLTQVVRNTDGFFLPFVRLAAVTALRQFADPQATAALKALAANGDEDPILRAAAV